MSPGIWPSRRLNASRPSSLNAAPTNIPPPAAPTTVHSGRYAEVKPAAAIPTLTPAAPSSAIANDSTVSTSRTESEPTPGWAAAVKP